MHDHLVGGGSILQPRHAGDHVQGVEQKMRIHLTFQIEHRHLLFRKLRTQRIRILQGQIECERHKRDSHSTDQPCMVQSLQEADCELKDQSHADGKFLLVIHPLPVRKQQP